MEMEKVPRGMPLRGFGHRGGPHWRSLRNWLFPFKLISSLWNARRILRRFRPELVVGVGGFASGPVLHQAAQMGIPTAIQEQNSFPGITNRLLAKRVGLICAGFPGLERWFPADRIVETGIRCECRCSMPFLTTDNPPRPHGSTLNLTKAVQWCLSWAVASVRLP